MASDSPDAASHPSPSPTLLDLLAHGVMEECRLAPRGSNYTFFATLANGTGDTCPVVYKPRRGEAPLWDFPDGTLYLREFAAYLVSEALGWRFVPPTVIRDGEHGVGSIQLHVSADPRAHYLTLRDSYLDEVQRMCAFDLITNNADRKSGHCLLGADGCIWAIDHGLTFHSQSKLRTVIWDFVGDPVPERLLEDLRHLLERFEAPGGVKEQLAPILQAEEVRALRARVQHLLDLPVFPPPPPRRAVPWPWL